MNTHRVADTTLVIDNTPPPVEGKRGSFRFGFGVWVSGNGFETVGTHVHAFGNLFQTRSEYA